MAGNPKVTRILHSRGLHRAKYDRLHAMAALCGRVRADAWQRCSGLSTAQQSVYEIRNAWRAEGYGRRGFPVRLGKTVPADTPENISAAREAHADSRNQVARRHMEPDSGTADIIPCRILSRDLQQGPPFSL